MKVSLPLLGFSWYGLNSGLTRGGGGGLVGLGGLVRGAGGGGLGAGIGLSSIGS